MVFTRVFLLCFKVDDGRCCLMFDVVDVVVVVEEEEEKVGNRLHRRWDLWA